MSNQIDFHSIGHFRHAVATLRRACAYHQRPLPVLRYRGYVKLHGTNGALRFEDGRLVHVQSRERILSVENDNRGFAAWANENRESLERMFCLRPYLFGDRFTIFGEWIGPGVTKNVALRSLPTKMFVPFAYAVGDSWVNEQGESMYVMHALHEAGWLASGDSTHLCFISSGGYIDIDIDFNAPDLVTDKLEQATNECEARCPFAAAFGYEGIGEGYVWHPLDEALLEGILPSEQRHKAWFKTKGDKHGNKATNNTVKVNVAAEKIEDFNILAATLLPDWRLEQGMSAVCGSDVPSKVHTGPFIKWVMGDLFKEELDVIEASDFSVNQVQRELPGRLRTWFFTQLPSADTPAGEPT